ncbi:MAG: leucine--tRNA ligase [Fimbriimonadaceae bacterium]|nr:leucine--tRNA ligase [Fimbriimonadaceae bacterium]QYK58931.1 MAG: leucine--tRNA ligase [Fimbriimonadaceae bacterium]
MLDRYEPAEFEPKWRKRWQEADLFAARIEEERPKFYVLDFFPYPSGAGLSVGHVRNYTITDVVSRLKRMQGYNVLHPMGFDAFGLPAENAAIKARRHPAAMIDEFAATYRRQMDLVGLSYDWSRSFKSSDPDYYRWTQWIFEVLYRRGLAYRKHADVNWCPKDKTALANEEVVGGLCERCGTPVEKRAIPQWFFKITEYAQRLLDDLDDLDWPEGIKQMQRNWIGRSEGVQFRMRLEWHAGDKTPVGAPAQSEAGDDELRRLEAEVRAEAAPDPAAEEKARQIASKFASASEDVLTGAGMSQALAEFDKWADQFEVKRADAPDTFEVFTTRIDTIFGMTFCVLAPEHPLVETIKRRVDPARRTEIETYQAMARAESDASRQSEDREKTGVFTGAYAVNPATGRTVPAWIADYVLMGYGTGAIMAVPAGDQRDFEFALKFGLPVAPIQEPDDEWLRANATSQSGDLLADYLAEPKNFKGAFVSKDRPLINAKEYTGMAFGEAATALGEWIEACGLGERKVQYRLRDWLISRQRYWGCPIPVVYGQDGEEFLVPEGQLPVELPDVDNYEPSDDGSSPLSRIPEFVNATTPDGRLGRRETDTMGGFACSSWYFLRFIDPRNDQAPWDKRLAAEWMPVDCYVGGAEHAVMHLLYARFWTKVLFDEGLVSVKEPFKTLRNQGQVLGHTPYRRPREGERLDVGEDGILISRDEASTLPTDDVTWKWVRMSKSKGNVVTPDEAVEQFGADALRLFELFIAPYDADVQWDSEGMSGTARFLGRALRFVSEFADGFDRDWRSKIVAKGGGVSGDVRRATHQAILKATEDIDRFAFNTYVSGLMICLNRLMELKRSATGHEDEATAFSEAVECLALLLAPGAPHVADEMWEGLGLEGFTLDARWPVADPELARDDTVTIAVQVNGKLRDTLGMHADADREAMEAAALSSEKIKAQLEGKTVRKVIVVPGKLVNVVAN